MPDEDRAWVLRHTNDHPLKTMTDKLDHEGNHLKIEDKIYVLCTATPQSPFHKIADGIRGDSAWKLVELPTHHHLNISMPAEVAEIAMNGAS